MTNVDFRQTLNVKFGVSAEDITRWLKNVPPVAKITVAKHSGDRNESETYSLTASWTGEIDD